MKYRIRIERDVPLSNAARRLDAYLRRRNLQLPAELTESNTTEVLAEFMRIGRFIAFDSTLPAGVRRRWTLMLTNRIKLLRRLAIQAQHAGAAESSMKIFGTTKV